MSNETKSRFTPGPWVVENYADGERPRFVTTKSGIIVAEIGYHDAARADARVLAAAPELLAALRSCEETLREYTSHEGLPRTGAKRADAIDAARAAIEKAEEES